MTNLYSSAIFIAWGCFYHCGGGETGLKNTIVCNIAGAVIAWIALLIVFLALMAATLIHIKSRMLLPRPTDEEGRPVEDPRQELVQRLLEYRRIKEAAQALAELLQCGAFQRDSGAVAGHRLRAALPVGEQLLQPLEAAPAWRGGEIDALRQLGLGDTTFGLQDRQDPEIALVELEVGAEVDVHVARARAPHQAAVGVARVSPGGRTSWTMVTNIDKTGSHSFTVRLSRPYGALLASLQIDSNSATGLGVVLELSGRLLQRLSLPREPR